MSSQPKKIGPTAEAMNMQVLEETKRVSIADMITANAENVERRVQEGFLALIMSGPGRGLHDRAGSSLRPAGNSGNEGLWRYNGVSISMEVSGNKCRCSTTRVASAGTPLSV